jgi:hypothetical protein
VEFFVKNTWQPLNLLRAASPLGEYFLVGKFIVAEQAGLPRSTLVLAFIRQGLNAPSNRQSPLMNFLSSQLIWHHVEGRMQSAPTGYGDIHD